MKETNNQCSDHSDDIRIALGKIRKPSSTRLQFAKQLGLEDVILDFGSAPHMSPLYKFYRQKAKIDPAVDSTESDLASNLNSVRRDIESEGLKLSAIEGIPGCSIDRIMFDEDGKEQQIQQIKAAIRNIGEAEIPIVAYSWSPTGVIRTSVSERIRGNAKATAFDTEDFHGMPSLRGESISESDMWDNYEMFLKEILPVAEDSGVKMALHPNDPPLKQIGGVPCLHRSFENFKLAMNLVPSENHGLVLGLGTWSEMGENLSDVIEHFGDQSKIFFVHFRDVNGTVPKFHETFVDQGNFDTFKILKELWEVGFKGPIMPDHVPQIENDSDYGHLGRAFTVGYLKSSLDAIKSTY